MGGENEDLETAKKIAARCGAIGLCLVCGTTWTKFEYEPDDEDSMNDFVEAARSIDDEELAFSGSDDELRTNLVRVLENAGAEKSCEH